MAQEKVIKGTKTHGHDFFNGITMTFSLFATRSGTSHTNAMNFVQKTLKYHEKCPYKNHLFFTRSSYSNLQMYYVSNQHAIYPGQKNQQVDLGNV